MSATAFTFFRAGGEVRAPHRVFDEPLVVNPIAEKPKKRFEEVGLKAAEDPSGAKRREGDLSLLSALLLAQSIF
jgi:hypothetical protein